MQPLLTFLPPSLHLSCLPVSVCLSVCDMAYVVFVLNWKYSLPSCASQLPWPFMWVQRLPFSQRWMCLQWKSRNGCHFSWHSAETNKPPPPTTPLRKLALAPPFGHKHFRVRSKIASKAKRALFHAKKKKLGVTGPLLHKKRKVQSKLHTWAGLRCAFCCASPPKKRC